MTRTRARRGEGDQLRDEIVEAGTRLLVETCDESAVTIRAVANSVGVTSPSIYRHFADKHALLLAVCEKTFVAFDDHIEAAVAGVEDPLEELAVRGRAYVRFGLDNPEHFRIMFMTRRQPTEAAPDHLTSSAFEHHFDAVNRACAVGALPPDTDPMRAALFLWVGVHGVTSLLVAKPDFPWPPIDEFVDDVLGKLIAGLSPP